MKRTTAVFLAFLLALSSLTLVGFASETRELGLIEYYAKQVAENTLYSGKLYISTNFDTLLNGQNAVLLYEGNGENASLIRACSVTEYRSGVAVVDFAGVEIDAQTVYTLAVKRGTFLADDSTINDAADFRLKGGKLLGTSVSIFSGVCADAVTWSVDTATSVLVISGSGAMDDFERWSMPWFSQDSSIRTVFIEDGVTNIGNFAFFAFPYVTDVIIPDSVTSIGNYAFRLCLSMKQLTVGRSVTRIGGGAFSECRNLMQVTFPEGLEQIGQSAFELCYSLTALTIPGRNARICENAFRECTSLSNVTILDGVAQIDASAFYGCSSLTSVSLPDSARTIHRFAFEDTALYNDADNWSGDVLYIDRHLIFAKNSLSGDYVIPDGTLSVGIGAFSQCIFLTRITVPDSVTVIGKLAFNNCTKLQSVVIKGVCVQSGTIDDGGFIEPCGIDEDDLGMGRIEEGDLCGANPADAASGNGGRTIGDRAFEKCTVLEFVHIPDDVTDLGTGLLGGSPAYICSDTEYCAAKTYADENGIEFRLCTGHEPPHEHAYQAVLTEPTCTTGGYTTYTCSGCGDVYTADETDPLGHDFGAWAVATAAGCTEAGVRTRACSRCHAAENETIAPLGHQWGAWNVVTPPAIGVQGLEQRVCERCGGKEEQPIEPPVIEPGIVSVTDAAVGARTGRQVKVNIELQKNPGLIATRLHIDYDPQILRLVKVENGSVFDETAFTPGGDLTAAPYTVLWLDALAHEDYAADGTLVTLTFEVQPTATVGDMAVTLTCDSISTFNAAIQRMPLQTVDGTVTVVDCTPGDADGDDLISLSDVAVICRALADGWNVTANEINGDVNGDGELNVKDIVLLRRFLAGGWGVELK